MKATCMLSLSFVFSAAVIARADTSAVPISNLTFVHRTNLIDIDQSQTLETLSVADEFTRLPVSSYKTAGVYFITNDKDQVFSDIGGGKGNGMEFEDPTTTRCKYEGYTITSCTNGNPVDVCPYNSSYFKECCDSSYNYTSENCSLLNTTSSCGKKYKCDCTPALYPVTAGSCVSPQIPATGSGKSCTVNSQVRYAECVCPEVYSETCAGTHLKGKGTGCSKNGTTKYTACECESGYNRTCSQSGESPSNPSDYCLSGGVKYYNNCKICENKCSLASCPTGVVCEKEACSGKYCDIGCDITKGYKDLDNYWCNGALKCLIK